MKEKLKIVGLTLLFTLIAAVPYLLLMWWLAS